MFDMSLVADLDRSVTGLLKAPTELATPAQTRAALRAIQAAQDELDGIKAAHLANLEATRGFEEDQASSLTAWVRRELRLPASQTRTLVAAAHTVKVLPLVGRSAAAGRIRLDHVQEFTFGLRHISHKLVEGNTDWLVEVAETCDPAELHQVIRKLRAALYPDDLDEAWGKGMDREDIALNKVPEGWHVTGFLGVVTGSKFKTILNALSKPRDRDDDRTASVRRVEALDEMLTSELKHGLPTDLGIRPQLNVMVDVETLLRQQAGESVVPAVELEGFGPIGPKLASYFICNAATTALLTDGQTTGDNRQANILDVGRAYRIAVPKQRKAVLARQHGICAAPGCTNTHLEIHHVYWWAQHHGQTDLDNLIAICSRCHHLVHRELLHIRVDGHGGFHVGDTTRVTRSPIKHITFTPHDHKYSSLETELRLLLIEERRRIRPKQTTEYQPTHHQLAPPLPA